MKSKKIQKPQRVWMWGQATRYGAGIAWGVYLTKKEASDHPYADILRAAGFRMKFMEIREVIREKASDAA